MGQFDHNWSQSDRGYTNALASERERSSAFDSPAIPPLFADDRRDVPSRHANRSINSIAGFWAGRSRRFRLLVILPAMAVLFSVGALLCLLIYYTSVLPNPLTFRKQEVAPTLRILAADGSTLAERGQNYDYIPIDLLPKHVIDAVVATEDRRFFDHWGLDPSGLARAVFANLRARRYMQGGSTLTQQLAKNLYLTSERTLARKFDELFLALWLEMRLSKQDIIELYLNRVYFGGGAFGIEAAARRYFDKSARKLTVPEAAVIAGLLKAPSKFSPASNPVLARSRARSVVAKMVAAGFLTTAEEQRAINTAIRFHDPQSTREITGLEYAIDYALERLPQVAGTGLKEVIIETTVDAALQKHAQTSLTKLIQREAEDSHTGQGGIVVLDIEGGIRALVGGRSYVESQFNRAVKAKRQPGSTFKTFVYLAALESGLNPDSTVYDLPFVINGWSPRNEGGSYRGAMSLRQGLAQSINTVAVRLHMDLGPKRTVAVANRLGIKSELRDGPSLALGTSEVTLLELTSAYGVFANGGEAMEPHIIRRVSTNGGRVIYQRTAKHASPIVSARNVGAMNDMLNATLVSGTGKRAGISKHPAAGKTGTSQDSRDAWFVGYTAHFVGGIWLGNDNGRAMNKIMGGTLPAKLWHDVMALAHEGRTPTALPGTAVEMPKPKPMAAVKPDEPNDPIASILDAAKSAKAQPQERIDDAFMSRVLKSDNHKPPQTAKRNAPPLEHPQRGTPPAHYAAQHQGPPPSPGLTGYQSGYFREAWGRLQRDRSGSYMGLGVSASPDSQ
jgi:penicillin-binding protein 1A